MAHQLAVYQKLVVPMPSCCKKAATAVDQGINTGLITLQIIELLPDGLADLADPRLLLLGNVPKQHPAVLRYQWAAKGQMELID